MPDLLSPAAAPALDSKTLSLPLAPWLSTTAALLLRTSPEGDAPAMQATHGVDENTHEAILTLDGARVAAAVTPGDRTLGLSFRVLEGSLTRVSLGLELTFADWSTEPYLFMPAAVYAGNRFPNTGTWRGEALENRGVDPEVIQTPGVPSLKTQGGGILEKCAGDMGVPAVGIYDPRAQRGLLLAMPQRAAGATNDTLLRFIEEDGATTATLEILLAGIRTQPKTSGFVPQDAGETLNPGDILTLAVQCHTFDCDSEAQLLSTFMQLRPAMAFTRVGSQTPMLARETVPFSEVWSIQERKFNEQNWVERHGYYSVGMREAASQDFQLGWVGGCNAMYPLLAQGDAVTRVRTQKMLDFLTTGVTPSGFINDRFDQGQWVQAPRIFLRHQADALYFITKSLLLLQARGIELKREWLAMSRSLADAFVTMWDTYDQIGQYAHRDTGELLIGRTCAAGLSPAGLLLACTLHDEPDYRRVAQAAGEYYASRFTAKAFTNGGPGDITQAHDSESAFALVASYAHLYDDTGEERWLDAGRHAAAQAASYVMTYDFDFPADSTFGQLGMRTRGTVFANVQNKHSAPGICTLSGISLLRLARGTGERQWLDLLADIGGAIPPYMSRRDRVIRDRRPNQRWPVMPEGWINERINTSDWEVRNDPDEIGVGEVFGGSTWSESAMLLTGAELPGVYVHTGHRWCVAIDHVLARLEDDVLHLQNPTAFDAHVRVLIESEEQARQPLDEHALLASARVFVPAQGQAQVALS